MSLFPLFCWRKVQASVAISALFLAPLAFAQSPLAEAQLKAAFVLNFVRYIEWPESTFASKESAITLCTVGQDNGSFSLNALEGRKVQERPIKVRTNVPIDSLRSCHVAFFVEGETRRLRPVLRHLSGQALLTVSDIEGFIDQGGAIGIVQGEQRLQFEVNRGALEQAKLKASSQLLKLARAIINGGG